MADNYSIQLAPGAEEIGLAMMISSIMSQNLEDYPSKLKDFRKLNLKVGLVVPDADIEMVLDFESGEMTIYPGNEPKPQLTIIADADLFMSLSNQKIKWGLPYYFDDTGKEIFRAMIDKRLQVKGLGHFPSLIRFSRVMSVH